MYFFLTASGRGHVQSLLLAAVLLIIAFQLIVLGILADLISANRKLIQENLFISRKKGRLSDKADREA
jgi:hypothetical protein